MLALTTYYYHNFSTEIHNLIHKRTFCQIKPNWIKNFRWQTKQTGAPRTQENRKPKRAAFPKERDSLVGATLSTPKLLLENVCQPRDIWVWPSFHCKSFCVSFIDRTSVRKTTPGCAPTSPGSCRRLEKKCLKGPVRCFISRGWSPF